MATRTAAEPRGAVAKQLAAAAPTGKAVTAADLQKATGLTVKQVSNSIGQQVRAGKWKRVGRGKYMRLEEGAIKVARKKTTKKSTGRKRTSTKRAAAKRTTRAAATAAALTTPAPTPKRRGRPPKAAVAATNGAATGGLQHIGHDLEGNALYMLDGSVVKVVALA